MMTSAVTQPDENRTKARRMDVRRKSMTSTTTQSVTSPMTQESPPKIGRKSDKNPRAPWRWRRCQACVVTCCCSVTRRFGLRFYSAAALTQHCNNNAAALGAAIAAARAHSGAVGTRSDGAARAHSGAAGARSDGAARAHNGATGARSDGAAGARNDDSAGARNDGVARAHSDVVHHYWSS